MWRLARIKVWGLAGPKQDREVSGKDQGGQGQ